MARRRPAPCGSSPPAPAAARAPLPPGARPGAAPPPPAPAPAPRACSWRSRGPALPLLLALVASSSPVAGGEPASFPRKPKPWDGASNCSELSMQQERKGCKPQWYTEQYDELVRQGQSIKNIKCPNGIRLPGDVTLSNHLSTPENVMCVFYGFVPMLVIAVAVVEFLYVRGTRELFFVLYVAVTTALNEVVLKGLVKQPRPPKSCAVTCGMPSSHATFAMGFFIVMFLDAASRINPMDVPGEEHPEAVCNYWMQRSLAFIRGPLSNPVTLSNGSFVITCLTWGFLLLPVPLSRIYVGDHSTPQVVLGSAAGLLYGFVFFYCVYAPFAVYMADAEKWRWPRNPWRGTHVLKNTIRLPWWRRKVNPHHISIVDSEPDAALVYGRSLVRVEVPIHLAQRVGGDGRVGVVHGQKLQVVGGHWSGVAWPIQGPDPGCHNGRADGKSLEVDAQSSDDQGHSTEDSDV